MAIRPFESYTPSLASGVYVDASALVIGQVSIGANSSIWPTAVLRGDIQSIQIGARSNIQDGTIVHVTHDSRYNPGGYATLVGTEVTVGHRVVLHGCTIEDRCLIGMGAIIMDDAIVHSGAMVGAGALVTQGSELSGGYLWLGSPARKARTLTDEEQEYIAYAAAHYVKLKNRYLAAISD